MNIKDELTLDDLSEELAFLYLEVNGYEDMPAMNQLVETSTDLFVYYKRMERRNA